MRFLPLLLAGLLAAAPQSYSADVALSALPMATSADSGDKFPFTDISATATKNITLANLKTSLAFTAADVGAQTLDSDLTAIAALATTSFGRSFLTLADAAAARTLTGAQPLDSDLTSIAALTTTTFGRSLLTQADAAAARTTLGVGSGSGDALVANPLSQFAATTSSQLRGVLSDETGTGAAVFGTGPSFTGLTATGTVDFSTATLSMGDISAGALTVTGITNNLSVFAATTSAQLRGVLSDETGSGAAVFGTSPDFTTGITIGGVAVPTVSSTSAFTNKRVTARVTTITSSATPTVNSDNCDCVTITALAAAVTSMTSGLSGTPANFDQLEWRIKDDGTARAIAWGASHASGTGTLPATTVLGKVLHVWEEYDTVQSKWICLSAGSEP